MSTGPGLNPRVLDTETTDRGVTLACPGSTRLTLQVTNAAVELAWGQGYPNPTYGPWVPFLPVLGALERSFDAIRIRSKTPGAPAHVFATAYPD